MHLQYLLLANSQVHAEFMDCLYFDGVDGEETKAPAEWRGNLRAHHCARRSAVPVPSPRLANRRWSTALATSAQNYAEQCVWAHSGAPGLGENLAAYAPWTDGRSRAATE